MTGTSAVLEPRVQPAIDAVFAAFEMHPLVGIGDAHGLAEEGEFYCRLVADSRFATEVGNVVVEFGSAGEQHTLDRYLAGEDVPYGELRRVWSDVVGWIPTVIGVMYQAFFAQVRAVNQTLLEEKRIRVWLGEPAIDWSIIHAREDFDPFMRLRDEHPAEIIEREILARGRKALVIYGHGHFNSPPRPSTYEGPSSPALREVVEASHPSAFYLITPYVGFAEARCSEAFEAEMGWPKGVLVAPVRGTFVETALLRPEYWPAALLPGPPLPSAELERIQVRIREIHSGVLGDALLYLGPAAALMRSPIDPTFLLDEAYFAEIARRNEVRGSRELYSWAELAVGISRPPQRFVHPFARASPGARRSSSPHSS